RTAGPDGRERDRLSAARRGAARRRQALHAGRPTCDRRDAASHAREPATPGGCMVRSTLVVVALAAVLTGCTGAAPEEGPAEEPAATATPTPSASEPSAEPT